MCFSASTFPLYGCFSCAPNNESLCAPKLLPFHCTAPSVVLLLIMACAPKLWSFHCTAPLVVSLSISACGWPRFDIFIVRLFSAAAINQAVCSPGSAFPLDGSFTFAPVKQGFCAPQLRPFYCTAPSVLPPSISAFVFHSFDISSEM